MTADQNSGRTPRLKRVVQEFIVAPALSLSLLISGVTGVATPANAQSTSKENIIFSYDGTTLTQVESTPRNIIRPRALRNPHLFGWNSSNETQVASNSPGNTSPNEKQGGVLSPSISTAGRPAVASEDGSASQGRHRPAECTQPERATLRR